MAYQRQAIIIETFNTLSINKRNSKMRALKEEISVEDYLRFFHSQKRFDFTVNFLNQVALSLLIFTLNFFCEIIYS